MSVGVEITRLDFSSADLRREALRCGDARAACRMLAIALVLDGASRTDAAQSCGMDRQTLRDWVHRYNQEGIAGLSNLSAPGRPAALTPEQMAQLKAIVLAGPDPRGGGVVRWRCCDLRRVIAERFEVEVHERTVGKLPHRLGLSRLKLRPHHPKRDLAAQEAFKKTSLSMSPRHCLRTRPASRSRFGSRTRPGSASRARSPTSGPNGARVHPGCAMTAMIPLGCSARSARPEASARRSSCPGSVPRR
jgi:transposase